MGRLGTIFIETICLIGLSGDLVTLKIIKTVLRVQYNNLFGIKYNYLYSNKYKNYKTVLLYTSCLDNSNL